MEHRCSTRTPCHAMAHVFLPPARALCVRIRDISTGGLFLETSETLPRQALVYLSFELTDGSGRGATRLPAIVVHRTREGAGLMFLETPRAPRRRIGAVEPARASRTTAMPAV